MRTGFLSLAAVVMLLAPAPAALAQDEEYVPGIQAESRQPRAQAPAGVQQPQPGVNPAQAQVTPAQTETETTPTETTPPETGTETTEEPPPGEPQEDSDEPPQQYTDPLAGEHPEESEDQPSTSTRVAGVQSVSAGTSGELARTGAPIGLIALAGLGLLGAGVAMRLLCRDSGYPYPYLRY